jgi:phosphate-selective porin
MARYLLFFSRTCALAFVATIVPLSAFAQSVESDVPPPPPGAEAPRSDFALPEPVGDATLSRMNVVDEHDRFSVKFGLVVMPADYTWFSQDDASVQQVGEQDDEWEARSLRLMARGHFEFLRRWNYMLSYEYNGFDQDSDDADWSTTDVSLSTDFEGVGTLTIGKIKEPFVYEMVGDAANLPHHERLLSPFFVSRNNGLKLSNTMLDQRGTWSIGWYNDWYVGGDSFGDSGNDVAARVTVLPLLSADGSQYLHVGAGIRYYAGDNDTLRFKGKPASNVADNYVDTGTFAGDHAWNGSLEVLWANRGYSLLGEYVRSEVRASSVGNPTLEGWYLTGSWILSGEHRPYDRKAGFARRVMPQGHWGAFELVGRVGRVDLDDAGLDGGTMTGWWGAVNWWASRRWKASIGYGDIELERSGLTGDTKTVLARIQWIY